MVSPIPRQISSLQHPLVKHLVKLRENATYRQACGEVLIVGNKLVGELARTHPLHLLIVTGPSSLQAEQTLCVTPPLMKKITGLIQPEPIAAVVALPPPGEWKDKRYLLALDRVADPGNLGTLLRAALALGWEAILYTHGTVDPFNDKALRAAKGATFHLPLYPASNHELVALGKEGRVHCYAADPLGAPLETIRFQPPLLLILGSEATGVDNPLRQSATAVGIPIASQMESLNVAVAGAILMYAIKHP